MEVSCGDLQFNLLLKPHSVMRCDKVALGFIGTGLENLHNILGKTAPLSDILTLKKFLSMSSLNFPCFMSLLSSVAFPPYTSVKSLALPGHW